MLRVTAESEEKSTGMQGMPADQSGSTRLNLTLPKAMAEELQTFADEQFNGSLAEAGRQAIRMLLLASKYSTDPTTGLFWKENGAECKVFLM